MDTLKRLISLCFLLSGLPSPCVAVCTGETYTYNSSLTICYWLVLSEQTAQLSQDICVSEGGNLAYIPDQGALDTVNGLKTNAGHQFSPEFYIGYRVYGTVVYVWDTNIEPTFTPWKSGQPSTVSAECVVTFNLDGTWWDEACDTAYKAMCSDYSPKPGPSTTPQPTTITTTTTTSTTLHPTTTTTMTTTTTTPQSTSTTMSTTTPPNCVPCACYTNTTNNQTVEEFREEVRKKLLVDTSTLSSSIRKKTSASDPRPSAAAVGYVGIILLTMVFGGIILMDAGNIVRCGKVLVNLTKKIVP
ncbi:endochitinase A-like [Pecten maximus]|uniref:endochitinase A-like n=1 Tax=Pecten maximus TaxID=6579 RepID=UPI001458C543|nr:endochitinase A-like [Pecten maximus]